MTRRFVNQGHTCGSYKKKFEKTGVVKQLRERSKFTKPSIVRREQVIKAAYKQKLQIGAIEK